MRRISSVITLVLALSSTALAQQQPYGQDLNRFYHYPYYYFPHNYWPAQGPRWPEQPGQPQLWFWPQECQGNGMFVAGWKKS